MNRRSRAAAGLLVALLPALIAPGCDAKKADTPTSGQVSVAVCEEVLPLIREEEARFEELYPEARVDLRPGPAREVIAALFNDSVKMIISARALNDEERAARKASGLEVREIAIAMDGLAVIVNADNDVTRLTLPQLDSIFSGRIMDWGILGWRGGRGTISTCVPDRNSAAHEIFSAKVLNGRGFPARSRVTVSSPEMIAAVGADPSAVGIVGLNWMRNPPAGVRIVDLSDPSAPDSLGIAGKYFSPHQAYLYKQFYPLVRIVYIYVTPDSYGVSTGFTSFITSVAGQKIVQNQGLVPATMPVRLVELRNDVL